MKIFITSTTSKINEMGSPKKPSISLNSSQFFITRKSKVRDKASSGVANELRDKLGMTKRGKCTSLNDHYILSPTNISAFC